MSATLCSLLKASLSSYYDSLKISINEGMITKRVEIKMKYLFASCVLISCGLALSGCAGMQKPAFSTAEVQSLAISLDSSKMMAHLDAFQKIATNNKGNRAVGTAGGLATAKYIMSEAKKAGLQPQMIAFENREKVVGQNIIVEIKGQNIDDAIVLGAHYDSVKSGPGINDNGSGTALLLELMHHLAQQKTAPKNTVYLAFWDSEEVGIAGSQAFVKKLSPEQLKHIKAYINVDMVGTKNPDIMIADATRSSVDEMEKMLKARGMSEADYKPLTDGLRAVPVHAGDLALEQELSKFFQQKGIKIKKEVSTLTASDTVPFLGKVPVASIILFNEQLKGDVLEFAPCYHQACDTTDWVDPNSLKLASEAILNLLSYLQNQ